MSEYNIVKWICPECHSGLNTHFACERCNFKAYIKNDMIYLHKNDHNWLKCAKERNGWVSISKEKGIYWNNPDHFFIPDGRPHLKEFYKEAKKSLDKLIELENFEGKLVLDVGAGIGWVECYILTRLKNVNLIALECNDDLFVGLGRSNELKKHHNCDFISLIADMHNIPIAENSIDIVFMVDALHHFSHMERLFQEVYRVLKSGGHFYAVNEPFREEDCDLDEDNFVKKFCPEETRHGINERRPTKSEYLEFGKILKLQILNEKINFVSPGLILYGEK